MLMPDLHSVVAILRSLLVVLHRKPSTQRVFAALKVVAALIVLLRLLHKAGQVRQQGRLSTLAHLGQLQRASCAGSSAAGQNQLGFMGTQDRQRRASSVSVLDLIPEHEELKA